MIRDFAEETIAACGIVIFLICVLIMGMALQ